jgi:hypothetical protein
LYLCEIHKTWQKVNERSNSIFDVANRLIAASGDEAEANGVALCQLLQDQSPS